MEELARRISAALRSIPKAQIADNGGYTGPIPTHLPKLSRREMEVLGLLVTGMTTRQIAETLMIQTVTARNHISNLLTKLGAKSRLQAVAYASQHGMV